MGWVSDPGIHKPLPAQAATVAAAAGEPLLRELVTGYGQAVVHAELNPPADDVTLAQVYQGRVYRQRLALYPRFGGEIGQGPAGLAGRRCAIRLSGYRCHRAKRCGGIGRMIPKAFPAVMGHADSALREWGCLLAE